MKTYRVVVTGGRDHQITPGEADIFRAALDQKAAEGQAIVVIHGAARGVDRKAAELAEAWGYSVIPYVAPWDWFKRFYFKKSYPNGNIYPSAKAQAGAVRNWMMVQAADLVVAFPGGRGTKGCIAMATAANVPVVYAREGEQ
jgi:hypothetical protein